jgi:receptor protein-tyrosine kinase
LAIPGGDRSLSGSERDEVDSMLLRESFRAVLTSILFSSQPERGRLSRSGQKNSRVLVVTSCDMMEGKTTVVTNLGIASALQKRDVLLIDADVRRPRLHQRLNLQNDTGLTDILQRPDLPNVLDTAPPESLVQATEVPHLWVLTAGQSDADSANLLYSADMDALVEHLSHRFDLIFIDTPPMSMYADARVLGQMSDGVVMVVRANTNSRDDVKAAYHQLLQDQIRVLGTILNDWKVDRSQARAYTRYYQNYERRA